MSEETRRAYRQSLAEFFQFVAGKHPADVAPADVMLWRDGLRSHRRKPATVAFKLAVVRSFFEHLRAAGVVALNPASTKLVPPPELPSEPAGRALTSRESHYLLSGPDREKPEGARDYALARGRRQAHLLLALTPAWPRITSCLYGAELCQTTATTLVYNEPARCFILMNGAGPPCFLL